VSSCRSSPQCTPGCPEHRRANSRVLRGWSGHAHRTRTGNTILPFFERAAGFSASRLAFCHAWLNPNLFILPDLVAMASSRMLRPSLLRPLLRSATRIRAPLQYPAGRRYASSEEGKSFKGQLYESTAERLHKERAEQLRFAQQRRQGQGWVAGGATLTVGI